MPLKKGFALLSPARRSAIASMGGIAVQAKGTGHRFRDETRAQSLEAARAAYKGLAIRRKQGRGGKFS